MNPTLESMSVYHNEECQQFNPPPDSSPYVNQVRKLIGRRMVVEVKDGRHFSGLFYCIDKQGNILLQDAVEYHRTGKSSPSTMEERCLGLILIPAACRTSCQVECFVSEQLSLLSLGYK